MSTSKPVHDNETVPFTQQQVAVIESARQSICQRGMKKTTMLALANDMGISRQTLYRTFENRDELLAIIYTSEFDKAVTGSLTKTLQSPKFEQAVAESVLLAITLVDENPILRDMMLGTGAPWFQTQILDRRSLLHRKLMDFGDRLWRPQLTTARKKKQLKDTLSDTDIVEWLLSNHYLTMVRPAETRDHHIEMLRKFVIPALLKT
ncbi:MAG: TetR/AcrR family transcriptional regulator [Gammaproteobacteria bacterium]|nr:TetR/AcrR family transcriptional regulator [Gammaproteobacteria bacterium]MBU1831805.1 TetR/AcrR family transcriptional regulator [Gammaproteobacteria bacterium]